MPLVADCDLWLLEFLRRSECDRTTAVVFDLCDTCDLLHLEAAPEPRSYALALAVGLGQALGRAPRLLAAGSPGVSFDEVWLLRLLERSRCCDSESVAFLIRSRVLPPFYKEVAFLIAGLSTPGRAEG